MFWGCPVNSIHCKIMLRFTVITNSLSTFCNCPLVVSTVTCSLLIFVKNTRFWKQSQLLMCCILSPWRDKYVQYVCQCDCHKHQFMWTLDKTVCFTAKVNLDLPDCLVLQDWRLKEKRDCQDWWVKMEEMDCQVLQARKVRTACGKGRCKQDR